MNRMIKGINGTGSLFPIYFVGEDVVEVIGGDKSIIIEVGLDEDLFNFFIIEVFSEILGNFFEFESGDFSLDKKQITALLISNDFQTLSTSSLLSLSLSLAVASLKNSLKSIPPD